MEVERDVEDYCVDYYGPDEVGEDEASAWVVQDEVERHDEKRDDGFSVDEEGETDAENDERGEDERVRPREDVAS